MAFIYVEGWGMSADDEPEYIQFKSDGTNINVQFDEGVYVSKITEYFEILRNTFIYKGFGGFIVLWRENIHSLIYNNNVKNECYSDCLR